MLVLALCAAVALLAGCGGSSDESRSTPAQAQSKTSDEVTTNGGDSAEGDHSPAGGKGAKGTAKNQDGEQKAGTKQGDDGGQKHSGGDSGSDRNDDHPSARTLGSKCGKQISPEDCADLRAFEKQHQDAKPKVTSTDECPAAMSQSECNAAGQVYEEAQGGGRVTATDECPAAMTEAQCIEAGKVYAEAMK
jgi:hypothetical protein